MKLILKMLARLYPSEWRRRYGAEYEALLEEGTPRVRDAFDVLWGAAKMQMTSRSLVRIVLPCGLGGALVATAVSFVMQPHYVSQTKFMVTSPFRDGVCGDQSDLPVGLRGTKPGICVDEDRFNRYLKSFSGGGLSRELLASVIQEKNLYPRERAHMPLNSVIDEMQQNIHVQSFGRSGERLQFVVQFDYPDPLVAQQVDDELVSQVLQRVWNEGTVGFLREQLGSAGNSAFAGVLRSQLAQAESLQSHGTFRLLNVASLPQKPGGLNRTQLGLVGLLGGLVGGFILAVVGDSRWGPAVAKD
jgi:hypothetical protein